MCVYVFILLVKMFPQTHDEQSFQGQTWEISLWAVIHETTMGPQNGNAMNFALVCFQELNTICFRKINWGIIMDWPGIYLPVNW